MVKLGQHYTAKEVSDAVVATLSVQLPKLILDIGAGRGSLSLAASSRFQGAQLLTVEVSEKNHRHLKKILPDASHVRASAFEMNLPDRFGNPSAKADIGVCNPPFVQLKRNISSTLLSAAGMMDDWSSHITQRAETLFLAQNLRMLKSDGELAIILPLAYANGHQFESFRRWLLCNHEVLSVIRLPASSFVDADVNTFSVTLRKGGFTNNFPTFEIHAGKSICVGEVQHADAIHRLIPNSLIQLPKSPPSGSLQLGDINAQVFRGTPVRELEALGVHYFHTTDFKNHGQRLIFGKSRKFAEGVRVAVSGDVLLGRVGRSCHLQAAVVASGSIPISDCIYRVRIPKTAQKWAIQSLLSADGAAWRESRLHGSAVSLLSKLDLMQHPVFTEH